MRTIILMATILASAACGAEPGATVGNDAQVAVNDTAGGSAAEQDGAETALPARASVFTAAGDKNCRTISTDEETGDWTGSCPGHAGYGVEQSSGDLRDDITLIKDGKRTELQLPTLVANGAFDSIGERIEWRGPAGGPPDVLVVRVFIANDQGENDGGHLAVARLIPTPCLIGIVRPQPGQSDKARAMADATPLPSCLKGAQ